MIALYLNAIFAFIIMALIFIFEVLSVIIQVTYYKKKHKRIFKMAPFHHHLEAIGKKEWEIDLIFFIIEFFLISIVLIFHLY